MHNVSSKLPSLESGTPNDTSGGGTQYTGSTECVSGYTCTYSNDYYSQCLPGSGPAAASSQNYESSPSSTTAGGSSPTDAAVAGSITASAAGNPFASVALYANPYYASEISTSAIPSLTGAMATAAANVANVPTFVWL
jgi:cellulose 1,4-beta-cellobiosidase